MSFISSHLSSPLQTAASILPGARAAAATNGTGSTGGTSSPTSSTDAIGSTFLSLLVQELQNQDPTAPMDSTAMVGQMISLNQLNQLTNINQVLSNEYGSGTSASSSAGAHVVAAQTHSPANDVLQLLQSSPTSLHPAVASSVSLPSF